MSMQLRHHPRLQSIRTLAGPTIRRLARHIQWRRSGTWQKLDFSPSPHIAHRIASHNTPFFRDLRGVEDQLQVNKITNLRLATSELNGGVLHPGKTMSFWRHVGDPTAKKGYLPGVVLAQGQLTSGVGGGLCQLTNLLYWMTLHTPLVVTERWRHSFDVFPDANRSQPFGSGATCAYPSLDVQIHNPTTTPFRLDLWLTDSHLHGSWTSSERNPYVYRIYETGHEMRNDLPGVYTRHNEIWRETLDDNGTVLSNDFITANDAKLMYAPFLATKAESRANCPAGVDV